MILHDLTIPGKQGSYQLRLDKTHIRHISSERVNRYDAPGSLSFGGALLYPGLINSHDHLEFNSFPQMGSRIYNNYQEWGKDIHERYGEKIRRVLQIPEELRIRWGLYKNLLNGFTSVVNHGKRLRINDELIGVFQENYPLHSPAFEKNWKWKLNNPFRNNKPFVMHIGEGTDELAKNEVAEVVKNNRWKRSMVAVHGVAMEEDQAKDFTGVVWCPASNYFLLGQTASITEFKSNTAVVFGTDSTLTGNWNAWEHFRQAIHSGQVSEDELLNSLTTTPASLWRMTDRGVIAANKRADLLIVRNKPSIKFSNHNPEDILLVMQQGKIRLMDNEIYRQAEPGAFNEFSRLKINQSIKWVQGNLPALADSIQSYYGDAIFPFNTI